MSAVMWRNDESAQRYKISVAGRELALLLNKMPLLLIALVLVASAARAQPQPRTSSMPDPPKTNSTGGKPSIVLPPEKAQPIKMPKFDKPPLIDGKLDDEVWKQAASLKDFYQIQPGDNLTPSKPTWLMQQFQFINLDYFLKGFATDGRGILDN